MSRIWVRPDHKSFETDRRFGPAQGCFVEVATLHTARRLEADSELVLC